MAALIALIAFFVVALIISSSTAKAKKLAESERLAAIKTTHAQSPFYDKIIAAKICQGMSEPELIASWGQPSRVTQQVLKTKVKMTYRYGSNRHGQSVYLENNRVTGWRAAK